MEADLDDKKLMDKLRSMCPPPADPDINTGKNFRQQKNGTRDIRMPEQRLQTFIRSMDTRKYAETPDEGIIIQLRDKSKK